MALRNNSKDMLNDSKGLLKDANEVIKALAMAHPELGPCGIILSAAGLGMGIIAFIYKTAKNRRRLNNFKELCNDIYDKRKGGWSPEGEVNSLLNYEVLIQIAAGYFYESAYQEAASPKDIVQLAGKLAKYDDVSNINQEKTLSYVTSIYDETKKYIYKSFNGDVKAVLSELKIESETIQGVVVKAKEEIIDSINSRFPMPSENSMTSQDFIITEITDTAPSEHFIGREAELKDLCERVAKGGKYVLVSGMGGIGKTHLCRRLFRDYIDSCKRGETSGPSHIGYLEYYDSMDSTLVKGLSFKRTGKTDQDTEEAWRYLHDLSQKKNILLIVDNVTKTVDEDASLRKLFGIVGTIILTSRNAEFERFKSIPIGTLPLDQCIRLFIEIYGSTPEDEKTVLAEIIEKRVRQHTITVELLARIAKSNGWTIAILKQKLDEKKFDLSFVVAGKAKNLQNEYEKLFDLAALSPDEINILEAFSLFTFTPLPVKECNEWMNKDAHKTEKDMAFEALRHKGWLVGDSLGYSMHPVIAESIFGKQKPIIDDHMGLVNACCKSMLDGSDFFKKAQKLMPYAEFVAVKLWNDGIIELSLLAHQIGYISTLSADYKRALEWDMRAVSIREKVLGDHPITAATCVNVATAYFYKYQCDEALEWYFKALHIYEKIHVVEDTVIAIIYNNIANAYSRKGELDMAQEWRDKALHICKVAKNVDYHVISSIYNCIAEDFHSKGEYDDALEWNMKALSICERNQSTEDPITAGTYNYIGTVYFNKGDYNKSLEWFMKTLLIREKILGRDHPDTATTYDNIANAYFGKGDLDEAMDWHMRALHIYEKVLGREHPDTAQTYNNIAAVYGTI